MSNFNPTGIAEELQGENLSAFQYALYLKRKYTPVWPWSFSIFTTRWGNVKIAEGRQPGDLEVMQADYQRRRGREE